MKAIVPFSIVALFISLAACSASPESDSGLESAGPADDSPPSAEPPRAEGPSALAPARPAGPLQVGPLLPPTPLVAAGWTVAGDPALFDVDSGALLSQAAGAGMGGEVDIACDPWHSRVIVFEGEAEGQWGEIAEHPLMLDGSGPELGARNHEVWVDGVARVAASPFGTIVFEEGYGSRWKLIADSGAATASALEPRPASLSGGFSASGDYQITALSHGLQDDSLDLRTAVVQPGGIEPAALAALPLPPAAIWPSARWVRAAGTDILVAAAAGDVVLSSSASGVFSPFAPLGAGPGIKRIEQVAALSGARVALLLSSDSGEVDVLAGQLDSAGNMLCTAALDLPGEPRRALLFFSRDLLVAGQSRLLAATSSGVFAVSVSEGCPLTLEVEAAFPGDALRGPLDLCPLAN